MFRNRSKAGYKSVVLLAFLLCVVLTSCWKDTAKGLPGSSPSPDIKIDAAVSKNTGSGTNDRTEQIFDSSKTKGVLSIRYLCLDYNKEKAGDSIIIITPEGKTVLIDAGIKEVGNQVDEYLSRLGIHTIDYAIATHPHEDHIGGYLTVLEKKEIKQMVMPNIPYKTSTSTKFMEILEKKKIPYEYREDGDIYQLTKDIQLEFMNPPKGTGPDTFSKKVTSAGNLSTESVNNHSLVIKFTYKNNTFLFAGDIYKEQEYSLLDTKMDKLKADYLHAGHHGDTTSSASAFIEAVNPKYVVMSDNVFNNFMGLERYEKNKANVYAVGLHGHILLTSDGDKIDVVTQKDWEKNF